jgi:hypothetical protein
MVNICKKKSQSVKVFFCFQNQITIETCKQTNHFMCYYKKPGLGFIEADICEMIIRFFYENAIKYVFCLNCLVELFAAQSTQK